MQMQLASVQNHSLVRLSVPAFIQFKGLSDPLVTVRICVRCPNRSDADIRTVVLSAHCPVSWCPDLVCCRNRTTGRLFRLVEPAPDSVDQSMLIGQPTQVPTGGIRVDLDDR